MSRDEILTKLLSIGAISLIYTILDVEAGRIRRVSLSPVGCTALTREVIDLLRSMGAEVEPPASQAGAQRLRRAG